MWKGCLLNMELKQRQVHRFLFSSPFFQFASVKTPFSHEASHSISRSHVRGSAAPCIFTAPRCPVCGEDVPPGTGAKGLPLRGHSAAVHQCRLQLLRTQSGRQCWVSLTGGDERRGKTHSSSASSSPVQTGPESGSRHPSVLVPQREFGGKCRTVVTFLTTTQKRGGMGYLIPPALSLGAC